jgi:catechol 2,3-dioxygenase-like lactoylglutathione lyase family enzyme
VFDHVSIGVRDLPRAKRFYDEALRPLGYSCISQSPESLGYGREIIGLWVLKAENPVRPEGSSGLHFCFVAPTRVAVDAFHAAAIGSGGRDNGAPGVRADYGSQYYAAFVVDPDGYRIEAYCGS